MPDLSLQDHLVCASCFEYSNQMESSDGGFYQIDYGPTPQGKYQYGWSCTCKGFKFGNGKDCKHIMINKESICQWNKDAFAGSPSSKVPKDDKCPECRGPLRAIRVGV